MRTDDLTQMPKGPHGTRTKSFYAKELVSEHVLRRGKKEASALEVSPGPSEASTSEAVHGPKENIAP